MRLTKLLTEALKKVSLDQETKAELNDCKGMFKGSKEKNIDLAYFDTSKVTDMSEMFYDCKNLEELDLTNFDTSKVKTMDKMFDNCYNIKSFKVSDKFFNTKAKLPSFNFPKWKDKTEIEAFMKALIDAKEFHDENITVSEETYEVMEKTKYFETMHDMRFYIGPEE